MTIVPIYSASSSPLFASLINIPLTPSTKAGSIIIGEIMLKNIDILIFNVKKTPINIVEKILVAATANEMYAMRIGLVLIFFTILMGVIKLGEMH